MNQDEIFMQRALLLAEKGWNLVEPNPYVGCVIAKNGKILSSGYHHEFGKGHAEIDALKKLKKNDSLGATLYVNLEPCIHFGKTPPCVPEILKSRIEKVVIGMKDPNPKVSGKGIAALRHAGIEVKVGCLEKESKKLNEKFIKNIRSRARPFVALKIAMSADGKIATKTGQSKWITGERSRSLVRKIRDEYDAILVGKNTALRDDPILNGMKTEPVRIILDSQFQIPLASNIFRNSRAILITTKNANLSKLKKLKKKNIAVKIFTNKIELIPLLSYLQSQAIGKILVEGGSEIFGSFIDQKLVDKIYLFVAPKIIGGLNAKPAVSGDGIKILQEAMDFSFRNVKKIGRDLFLELYKRSP